MGALILRARRAFPPAYRDLPAGLRTLAAVSLPVLALLAALVVTAQPAQAAMWVRAELTFAAAAALTLGAMSVHGTTGRVRAVRRWATAAAGFWLLSELIRDVEMAIGIDRVPAASDIPFVGALACAALTYSAALRGRLRRAEEWTVYLDGAIVFFATAGVIVTVFGAAAAEPAGAVDLLYSVCFLATAGATLLLDLAVRVQRRPEGAYVLLAGLVLVGVGFLLRLVAPPATGLHEAGVPGHLLALGVVLAALGAITWTDVMDDSPGYARFASRLRTAMPIAAVVLTALVLAFHLLFLRQRPGSVDLISIGAIGVVIVLVAIRQTVLLYDREEAIGRERELGRELSSAELKYRSLVERQPGVVYIAEPGPVGRWYFVGPQVGAMLGYGPDEWTADPGLWARLHPSRGPRRGGRR